MDKAKATQFVTKYMNGLWPKWSLTWPLQDEWVQLVSKYDEAKAKDIIRQMLDYGKSSNLTYPVRREFLNYARTTSAAKSEPSGPEPNAHIICYDVDDDGRGTVGMLQTLGWTTELVPMHSRPETLKAIDTNKRAYGGRWLSYCGSGIDARLKANEYRRELRAKAPVPTPAAPPEPAKLPPDISTVGQILAGNTPTQATKPLQIDTIGDGDFEPAEEIVSKPQNFDGNQMMEDDEIPF